MNDEPNDSGPESSRPKFWSIICSAPFYTNSLFGWFLLGCFWLPFGIGCDKKTVLTPANGMGNDPPESLADLPGFLVLNWPFFFGAFWALVLFVVAIVRPQRLARWLFPLPAIILLLLTLFGFVWAFIFSDERDERLTTGLIFFMPPMLVLVWVGFAIRSRDWLLASIRAVSGLSLIMPVTLYFYLFMSFASRFLIGFYCSIFASIGLTASSWLVYARGEQVFSSVSLPRRKIQFRIRSLMIWTAVVAGAAGAIQYLFDR